MKEEKNNPISHELQAGTVLGGGKYIIIEKVGGGGFGLTYKASQSGLNRIVCIKEYFPSVLCERATHARTIYARETSKDQFERFRQAFVREAKIIAKLHHPNIVEVFDVFDENNTSYMVMDYIEGQSLQKIVEKRGRLPYPEVVNYIAQVTSAVGYIHQRKILHRDIKPDNIMITADYKAILIDFGSAREFVQDKTQHQTSLLTPGFAPFEQYSDSSRKGSYTDIYAIGATMYYVLTGRVPLDPVARIQPDTHFYAPKELAPDIPEEANRTILKAMQVYSKNRHQTVKEFMDDLCNIKPSVLVDETKVNSYKRLWQALAVAGCIIVVLIGFLIFKPKVDSGKTKYKTFDFTGWNAYPMIKVEGGSFEMGTDYTDEDDCSPHYVTLSDFFIGQFEVSQELWEEIMGTNPSAYQSEESSDVLPVDNVSFEDVQEFINRLNNRTGEYFSLPTEAQWEYAARGGKKSKGTTYAGSESPSTIWYGKDQPTEIDYESSVNELGIYQMSGNVAEWCVDYYDSDFYLSSGNSMDPVNLNNGKNHVIRGGSFDCGDEEVEWLTVYYRLSADGAEPGIGLRLVIN